MARKNFNPDIGKNTRFSSTRQPAKNGRPKGSKSLATIIRELEDEDFDWARVPVKQKDLFKKFGAPWRAIVMISLAKACNGDMRAADWLAKFGYGEKFRVGGVESDEIKIVVVNEDDSIAIE